jgi:hypothetical protein
MGRWARVLVAALFVVTAGCASPERLEPVPTADATRAAPLGLANARFFPGEQHAGLLAEFEQAVQRQRKAQGLAPDAQLPAAELLAISGGGDDGARIRVLVGWTEAGSPRIELVTGQHGSATAPFAFLGQAYDRQLRDIYTTVSAEYLHRARIHRRYLQ